MMKNNVKYIILFFVFLFSMIFVYIPFRMDTYVNYGFSYGIANGQIPYKDFNLIVPLFGPFIYSILLFFNKSILVFYIEQSILLVLFSKLLFKMMDRKAWIIIVALFCPFIFSFAYCLFPGYNFLILFEMLLLVYLHDNNKSDKLIGFIAGISLLTKQNIGIFILLVTIFYPFLKNKKQSLVRFIYSMIPVLIFFVYLLLSNSFLNFINLCFLNLYEFTGNFQVKTLYLILFIISLFIVFISFFNKKDKNISYYYLFGYIPIVYPLIESHHVSLFLFFAFIVMIYNMNFKVTKLIPFISFIIIIIFIFLLDFIGRINYFKFKFYSFHNFPAELLPYSVKEEHDEIIKYVPGKKVIYVGDPSQTIFFTSTTSSPLNMYYILFKGNQGYNGRKNLIANIKNEKNTYFIISKFVVCYDKGCQFDMSIPELIENNYKLVKELDNFSIYYKE